MSDLTGFLLARIAEDEDYANEAGDFRGPRLRAECAAKRHIVEVHVAYEPYRGLGVKCETCADNPEADYDGTPMVPWPCGTIRAVAHPYADHPEFREEWRL